MASLLSLHPSPLSFSRRIQEAVSNFLFCPRCVVRCSFRLYPTTSSSLPKRLLNLPHTSGKIPHFASGAIAVEGLERSMMFSDSNSRTIDMNEFERQLQELFNQVNVMIQGGNKKDATHILQANYEIVKEQLDDGYNGIEQAAILDTLALGYMGIGDLKIVGDLLKLLKEIIYCIEDDQPLLDSILLHMGSMCLAIGKFDDAALAYDRCLKILEKKFGDSNPFLITPLMGRAKAFRVIGRSTKAIAIYHRAIKILEQNRGIESEELVVPLFSLGDICISEGKASEAESCFKRSNY